MTSEILEKKLKTIFSSDEITSSEISIPTKLTVYPSEIEKTCELVKLAIVENITILPLGGATRLFDYGKKFIDVGVSLSHLKREIEHSPADLIASIPAGKAFDDVQNLLATKDQMIPLDPPTKPNSTIGGIVSSNAFGPRRHRYGTIRDWVTGIKLINGKGEIVQSGSKVVKNVSGYDLNKLYIGSRGTLGIIIETIFKLFPIPAKRITIHSIFDTITDVYELLSTIRKTPLDIEAMAITRGEWNHLYPNNWNLLIELAGSEKGLQPQIDRLLLLLKESSAKAWNLLSQKESLKHWLSVNQLYTRDAYQIKISLTWNHLKEFLKEFDNYNNHISLKIFPDSGICYMSIPTQENEIGDIVNKVKVLSGTLEFESMPPDSPYDRWPILPPSFPLMQKIKEALDPNGIFAPGTFIGGI